MSLKDLIAYGVTKKLDLVALAKDATVAKHADVVTAIGTPLNVFLSAFQQLQCAQTWYVNSSYSPPDADGLTPETPFEAIQDAVDAATAGDLIVVAPGFYDTNYGPAYADGLKIAKNIRILGVPNQTILFNTHASATSVVHLIGDTGVNSVSLKLDGFMLSGSGATTLLLLDQDTSATEICNCLFIPDSGWGIHITVNKSEAMFISIHDNLFASLAIEAKPDDGELVDDAFVILNITHNQFLMCDPAISIDGDHTAEHNLYGIYIGDNDFNLDLGGNGFIDLGEWTGFNAVVKNRFGVAAALVTVKDGRAGSGMFSNTLLDNVGMGDYPQVSPYCAAPITAHDGYVTTPYTFGSNYVLLDGTEHPLSHIKVTGLTVAPDSVDLDWAIELLWGPLGGELPLSKWEGQIGSYMSIPELASDFSIPSGNRVVIRVACDNGDTTSHRIGVRLQYKVTL